MGCLSGCLSCVYWFAVIMNANSNPASVRINLFSDQQTLELCMGSVRIHYLVWNCLWLGFMLVPFSGYPTILRCTSRIIMIYWKKYKPPWIYSFVGILHRQLIILYACHSVEICSTRKNKWICTFCLRKEIMYIQMCCMIGLPYYLNWIYNTLFLMNFLNKLYIFIKETDKL